jgi:REP element-mobilizing transposase RayT
MNKTTISNNTNQSRDRKGADECRKGADENATKPILLAYFVTFSCYGTHLHGHESESVDRSHNKYGAPHLPPDEKTHQREKENMKQEQYIIDNARARIVLDSIIKTSIHRKWNLLAVHVRSTHVHVVIQALTTPEKVMNDFKSYASRALNKAGFENADRKRWTRHGSTRYLWKTEELANIIQYVLHEQGAPMVVYENKCLDFETIFINQKESIPLPHGT